MLYGSFWIFLEIRGRMFCFFQKNDDEKILIFFLCPRPAGRDSPIWNIYAGGVFNIPRRASSTVENFVHKRPKIRADFSASAFSALCPRDPGRISSSHVPPCPPKSTAARRISAALSGGTQANAAHQTRIGGRTRLCMGLFGSILHRLFVDTRPFPYYNSQ